MAHKFAFQWHVFTINYATTPPQFVPRGVMDLTTIDENGVLANGVYHEQPTSIDHPIKGAVGPLMSLMLAHTDASVARYEGLLVRDHLGDMTIAGRRLTPRPPP